MDGSRGNKRPPISSITPPAKKRALVDYLLRAAERGFPIPLKLLLLLAHVIARPRSSPSSIPAADVELESPRKNWLRGFRSRHPEIAAKKPRPLEWARNDIEGAA
ncbi:hypothetical protein AYO20_08401 [Fonsecaea nubica]|uniref:HTH CENPB-type domain-containing protein n=1 Tax=Fonsecaea nubica TaxID=856822 RepID=A0A178CMM3_9EURO|nr:hypothetical protein AYO20_08401 [Fonsecaea nubica]OAL31070.1 hypothetical protein AYO20_08401 [Fonsecaea nubica]